MSDYREVSSFEEIISLAVSEVRGSGNYRLNFNLPLKIAKANLMEPHFPDVVEIAKQYSQKEKPDHLWVNHGQYYNGHEGVQYIIKELNNKHDGNRAVLSLINHADIVDSGDNPIPSFMIMQFSIENQKDLYVTTYFRALEVSKFLRINLEEFRLILVQIFGEILHLECVYLNVFAFRAYINERLNPFIRPQIELMDSTRLLKLMEKSPADLALFLKELDVDSTYIENKSLKSIQKIVHDNNINMDIMSYFKDKPFQKALEDCISSSEELIQLRTKTSHNEKIATVNDRFMESLRSVIKEIERHL